MAKAKYKYNEQRKEWSTLVWDGTYTEKGEKHRKRITSKKSSADLERKVTEFRLKVENQTFCEFSTMSFHTYAEHWLETAKSTREKNTQIMYKRIIDVHLSNLSDVRVSDIKHSHFQMLINRQMEHPRTCQQISLTFKQIIKAAIRDRILPRNALEDICTGISLPKYHKNERRPLTALEKQALSDAKLDDKKRAFVSVLFYFGVRRGEALALTPFDFNWHKKELNINKAVIFVDGQPELKPHPKSDNGIRKIPIPDEAVRVLKPFVESCDRPYLFDSKNNDLMTKSSFVRMWQSIITSMNIAVGYNPNARINRTPKQITDLTPHIFRHNYCTTLCYQVPKISTKMIARILGDTEKMVLEVYSHIVEEKENVAETVNEAIVL